MSSSPFLETSVTPKTIAALDLLQDAAKAVESFNQPIELPQSFVDPFQPQSATGSQSTYVRESQSSAPGPASSTPEVFAAPSIAQDAVGVPPSKRSFNAGDLMGSIGESLTSEQLEVLRTALPAFNAAEAEFYKPKLTRS
jgi:hypothetical protein